ncbi:DNA-binding protein [Agromyces intestinalis]|uniref:DNA-binding protein n=1 Tax=Agromyces intestinalis TaxID=2592652 RepID=A0A5C1YCF2_9MICO|nr:DNA-binding protein [Agromyces intestinalis]QEO13260.1 DNA-binding protein [Agromyces intestinalis]
MFVITADQIGSRRSFDQASELIDRLESIRGDDLTLPADQTAGDEVQLLTASAAAALDLVLEAARDGRWSVGLGVGEVRTPLPDAARKASGPAFIAARDAVEAAKRADGRVALRSGAPDASGRAGHVEALLRLLVLLRARRSDAGWEVVDLAREGRPQKEIAALLDVSPAAVSARLKAALWRAEEAAVPAIVELLADLDAASGATSDRPS